MTPDNQFIQTFEEMVLLYGSDKEVKAGQVSAEEVDDETGPMHKDEHPLSQAEAKAREDAKNMGSTLYGCPQCEENFARTVDLELHVHREHPTKNAYPARKVMGKKV